MSRHHIRLSHCGGTIVVVAGYDRPLRQLFLQVLRGEDGRLTCEDDILYDSLHEPALDWGVISTLTDKLLMLDITVPQSLIEAVYLDQCFTTGNRVVRHHADRPPEVLMTG
ncbi:MAG: hypothetical protein KGZ68_18020 [Dechloromonas sp.]|jgi:hypothetical protein|uniref:hypothetical protein n=1 Tax=Dechloromonas sp. CZR5 TaxID=2608630 RepID=UPI00123DB0F0|nr:hypothetical protein [Dechloromonas sp. CZR5]MBS4020125.1 hypothetical protein [Dechloromonas sp.]